MRSPAAGYNWGMSVQDERIGVRTSNGVSVGLLVLSAGLALGLALGHPAWGQAVAESPAPAAARAPDAPAAEKAALAPVNPERVAAYRADVAKLADPKMEGRGPGTVGNRLAAEMLEARFKALGLRGGMPGEAGAEPVFMQEFTAGRRAVAKSSNLSGTTAGTSTNVPHVVLGFSGSGKAEGPLAFVGYSIQKGGPERDYSSYGENDDLSGKIAVILRFEPMDEQGKSKWRQASDGAWTTSAGLSGKIQQAVSRGAAGVIIVNTPGADDERVTRAESTEGTTRWMREVDVPAAIVGPEQFDALLKSVGERRTGLELRRLADEAGGVTTLGDGTVTFAAEVERAPRVTWNVAAVLPGVGELAEQYVVVGAHFDHVGYGYTGGSRSDEFGIVHPGADDNASGTAGLLQIAADVVDRAARSRGPRRSIVLIGFSAEEMGLIGSREFVKASPLEASAISAMINLDMIGRLRDEGIELAGTGTAAEFGEILDPLIAASGIPVDRMPGGRGPSDHATFYAAGIPVLHFFTGLHDEYHTPRDVIETINFEGGVRVADLALETTWTIATRPERLTFTSTSGGRGRRADANDPAAPTMGAMKVRFGIAPGNYGEENEGVLVDGVTAGTSAAEAGIVKGDVLVKWNGEPIADVAQWMTQLAKHNPGDVVDVTIKREGAPGGETVVRVTLKSRDQVTR